MPITLKVEAQADNRSFKQAADHAERYFSDAGKAASGSFSKAFGDGAKDVRKATDQAIAAYDAVADAVGKAKTAEKQRQQYLAKSESLTKQAADAEKRLGQARNAGDTKAVASAERELERIRDQQNRTSTQVVRSAEATSRARRQEQREIREAVSAYRNLQQVQNSSMSVGRGPGFLSGITSQSSGVVGQFSSLGGSAGKAFVGGAVAAIVAGGFIAAGAKAAGMVVEGFKSVMDTGIDFSRQINTFQGVTGATAGQSQQMSAAARALGADTTMAGVSASDAASAMTELAKAGFTVDQAIEAARGTMLLATAATMDAASAAEIQANTMNMFGLEAKDAAQVADIFANAEQTASGSMQDMALALQQGGPVARMFGMDLKKTMATLTTFADLGIQGSDAGTLMKTSLLAWQAPSEAQADAMAALNLQLEDSNGNFVGYREMLGQLSTASKHMTQMQFNTAAATLLGTDAIRAAGFAAGDATRLYDDNAVALERVGTAADMGKAKMQGWPGIVEGISNSTEALKLSLYDVLDTPGGRQVGHQIVEGLDGMVEWVDTHKPELLRFFGDVLHAGVLMGEGIALQVGFTSQAFAVMLQQVGTVAKTLGQGMQGITEPLTHIPDVLLGPAGSALKKFGQDGGAAMVNFGTQAESGAGKLNTLSGAATDFATTTLPKFDRELQGTIGRAVEAEEQNRVYAESFKQLKGAVEMVPGSKEIVLRDNTPEVMSKLRELGFAVQNLPNGQISIRVEYRDPSGKIVDPNQLGVSQRQLDDRGSRQHDWGIDPPAAAGPTPPAGGWPAWDSGSGSSSSTSLPEAPVLPIQYTDTAGMSPEMQAAQNRADEARHNVAEKEARVNQLLQSNVATGDEIQKARNDLAKAQQDNDEAQKRLQETQMKTYQKSAKELNGMASTFSDIGAQLDKDLGLSNGLAGIADNLVRFIATLAAAPLLGQLSAISDAAGDEGSGLMGVLASNGALGERFLPSGPNASNLGPAELRPGSLGSSNPNVNAMLALAQASSGKTAYGPASDLINGLADCSGSISDLYEVLTTGRSTGARMFDTTNFASDAEAAKLGFLPGYMPGALNVGVNPYPGQSGHMAATLPNGVNFEGGGGTGGGAQYGGSAAGALDPQFEKRYYLPVGGMPVPSSSMSTTTAPSALTSSGGPVPVFVVNMPGGGLAALPIGPAAPTSTSTAATGATPDLYGPENTNPGLNNPGAMPSGAPLPPLGSVPGSGGPLGMPGIGMPQSFGPGANLGGQPYPASPGGGGGVGMGGMAMDAAMLATSGLDMMAPGAGAAAKMGIQLANRTIKYAGQVASIGVSGLLDTITPAGNNPKASIGNSWLGKIVGGIAGASPALPNMAGGKAPAMEGGPGQQQGQGGNTVTQNVELHNHRATEDMMGNQAVRELGAMHAPAGRQ